MFDITVRDKTYQFEGSTAEATEEWVDALSVPLVTRIIDPGLWLLFHPCTRVPVPHGSRVPCTVLGIYPRIHCVLGRLCGSACDGAERFLTHM